jgi:hypothetical protein
MRARTFSSEVDMDRGAFSFDLTSGETNQLTLIYEGTEGQLFINGEFVATRDLDTPGALGPGCLSEYSGFVILPHSSDIGTLKF